MRIFLTSLAAAASALAVASPASAQVTGQHYGYPAPGYGTPGYGAPGYGYGAPGYGYRYGHVRVLQVRIDSIQRQIRVLDRRNILSNRQARRLRQQSRAVEHRLVQAARRGLNPWEARDIESRILRLEHRVQRAMSRSRFNPYPGYGGYPGHGGYPGYSGSGGRDRDDDDRFEDRDRDDDDRFEDRDRDDD